jgi:transcriptional regulator with XRE-family HTH domain
MGEINPFLHPIISALRAERERLGISQEELTERCNFTEKQIAKWEIYMRQPTGFMLTVWAHALGMVVVPVPASTMQSELKAGMDAALLARRNATAITNCSNSKEPGKSKTSNSNPSTISALQGSLWSFLSESRGDGSAPATPPTSDTPTAARAA